MMDLFELTLVRFFLAGIVNTMFGWVAYSAFLLSGLPVWGSLLAAIPLGVAFNFLSLGGYAFRDLTIARLPKFLTAYAIVYLVNLACLELIEPLNERPIVAQLILSVPIALLSYVLLSKWVFQRPRSAAQAGDMHPERAERGIGRREIHVFASDPSDRTRSTFSTLAARLGARLYNRHLASWIAVAAPRLLDKPHLGQTQVTVFDAALLLGGTAFVVIFSVWQGAYNFDPHHWGLMVENVVALTKGREPYRDVFIQYGFLTTLVEYGVFSLGRTVASIIAGVALCHAIGLASIHLLYRRLGCDPSIARAAFLTALLVHPLAIYPWANYVAFPFIALGCVALVGAREDRKTLFMGGVLFGLATLAREGVFMALALAVAARPAIHWATSGVRPRFGTAVAPMVGFAVPLLGFATYLIETGNAPYWKVIAVDLPALYMPIFFEHGAFAAIENLLRWVLKLSLVEHSRRMIFGLIVLAGAWLWGRAAWTFRRRSADPDLLFVALLSGLLLTSALHLNEVFRLATSSIVGVGLIHVLAARMRILRTTVVVTSVGLTIGFFGNDGGNYFLPSRDQIATATTSDRIPLFSGQRWSPSTFAFYDWFVATTERLEARACGIRHLRNSTRDAYLAALSPFAPYQLMPFGSGMHDVPVEAWSARLRPDYDVAEHLRNRDVMLVSASTTTATAPEGYRIWDMHPAPQSRFLPPNEAVLIITPEACGSK